MVARSRTAKYYAENPEARKKHVAYQKKRNARPDQRKYKAELSRERRARGIDGKGGKDLSHTEGGGFKLESPSANRARNGHGDNKRLAPGRGTRKSKRKR